MTETSRVARAFVAVLVAVSLVGCSGGNGESDAQATTSLSALFASFDVAVGDNPRLLVGLVADDNRVVSFGSAEFSFSHVGDGKSQRAGRDGPRVDAAWIPLPGQDIAAGSSPTLVNPSEGTGVYAARDVRLDRPGFWEVEVRVDVGGRAMTATAAFEVQPEHQVLARGDQAPVTPNPLPGAPGVDPKAIDSRADDDGTVPDLALHRTSVADALASGRPTMVVVSTPVFCQSRFCGPITDAIDVLAGEYRDRVHFAHLEVWEDFEAQRLTKAARQWIEPESGAGGNEPWVFLVGADGVVIERWDNVASEPELRAALDAVTD